MGGEGAPRCPRTGACEKVAAKASCGPVGGGAVEGGVTGGAGFGGGERALSIANAFREVRLVGCGWHRGIRQRHNPKCCSSGHYTLVAQRFRSLLSKRVAGERSEGRAPGLAGREIRAALEGFSAPKRIWLVRP